MPNPPTSPTPLQRAQSLQSVQKQTGLGVLDNPGQALFEILAGHGAAPQDVPRVCPDLIQPQPLGVVGMSALVRDGLESVDILAQPTFESSSPVMHPTTSVLFANTNRLAPESRFPGLSATSACPAKGQPDAHLLLQKAMQLLPAIVDAQPVCGIHHPDQGVGLLKVISPVRPQRLLASDIPCVPVSLGIRGAR